VSPHERTAHIVTAHIAQQRKVWRVIGQDALGAEAEATQEAVQRGRGKQTDGGGLSARSNRKVGHQSVIRSPFND